MKTFGRAADAASWVATVDANAVWLVARFKSGGNWTGDFFGFTSTQSYRSTVYSFAKVQLLKDTGKKQNTAADALASTFAKKRYAWGDDIEARHAEEQLIMSFEDIRPSGADEIVALVSKSPCATADRRKSAVLCVDGHHYPESCTSKIKEASQVYTQVRWDVCYIDEYGNLKTGLEKRDWTTLVEHLGAPIRRTSKKLTDFFA